MAYGGVTTSTAPTTGGYQGVKAPATVTPTAPVAAPAPKADPFNPFPTTSAPNPFADQAKSSFNQGVEGMNTILNPSGGTPLQGAEAALKVGAAVAGVASAPLAPVVALTSKAIEFAGNALSNVPQIQEFAKYSTPNDLRVLDALQNLGGVAMGILGVKAGETVAPEKVAEVSQHPEVQAATRQLADAVKAHTEERGYQGVKLSTKSETPNEFPVAVKTEEGNGINNQPEPYTPPEQLPTIQMGPAEKGTLPTIQAEAPKTNDLGDGLKLVPEPQFKTPRIPTVPKTELPTVPSTEVKPVGRTTQTLKPVEGTGDLKTRGLSQNIEATAIEKQLADNFGDLPEYRQVSMADQARQSAELIAQDRELAKQIALGKKAAPKGLLPESVLVAVEHDATVKGDVEALRELANSKLASTATTMGQRIRTLGERDSASPIEAIRQVQQAREEALASRGVKIKEQTVTRIKESIKKTNTKKNWADFVESITC